MFNYLKSYENSHIPPHCKQCVFMMNQKHVFGYRFLVTNRNVFEGHENMPQAGISRNRPCRPVQSQCHVERCLRN